MKQLIYFLIAGTRGGELRARIIFEINKKPLNANQLSKKLKCDYKTITHHIDILTKNKLITKQGNYGGIYFLSETMQNFFQEFEKIWNQFGNDFGKHF